MHNEMRPAVSSLSNILRLKYRIPWAGHDALINHSPWRTSPCNFVGERQKRSFIFRAHKELKLASHMSLWLVGINAIRGFGAGHEVMG